MNYSGNIVGSRTQSFMDMLEGYFDLCLKENRDSYQAIGFLDEVWGSRIEEWGWDLNEFLTIMLDFYEGLQENRI